MKYLMAIAYLYDMCDQMIIFDYCQRAPKMHQ